MHKTLFVMLSVAGSNCLKLLRDLNDGFVRIHVKKRWIHDSTGRHVSSLSINKNASIQAIRLSQDNSNWTAFPRTELYGNHSARSDYVITYLYYVAMIPMYPVIKI